VGPGNYLEYHTLHSAEGLAPGGRQVCPAPRWFGNLRQHRVACR
jgi:hypothetical protein